MILVAPTAFKGTLSARAAARAMARGVTAAGMQAVEVPLSDGGHGLIDALDRNADRLESVRVSGPLGTPVQARVLWRNRLAVLESADACGLHLVAADARDPWHASTRGVGELIAHAAARTEQIVLGLGGSATVDGGIGMAAALGWRFLDAQDRELEAVPVSLPSITGIVAPAQRLNCAFTVLADVSTPLTGPCGAARIFGPQKGVAPADLSRLDAALRNLAEAIERDLAIKVYELMGGGAAGGLGAAVHAFLGGHIMSGSEWLLEQVGFDALLAQAQLVITGEGSYDQQSALGKITGVVVERARAQGIPVLLVAGRIATTLPAHVHAAVQQEQLTPADLTRLVFTECSRLLPS